MTREELQGLRVKDILHSEGYLRELRFVMETERRRLVTSPRRTAYTRLQEMGAWDEETIASMYECVLNREAGLPFSVRQYVSEIGKLAGERVVKALLREAEDGKH